MTAISRGCLVSSKSDLVIKLSDVPPVVTPLHCWLRVCSDPDRNLTFFTPSEEVWTASCKSDDWAEAGGTESLALLQAREVVFVATTARVVERNTPPPGWIEAPPGESGGVGGLLVLAVAGLQVFTAGQLGLSLSGPVLTGVGALLG